jgi:hypothetical protein
MPKKEPKKAVRNRERGNASRPAVRGKRFPLALKNSGVPSAPSDRFPGARIALHAPPVDSAQKIHIPSTHPNMSGILAEIQTYVHSS